MFTVMKDAEIKLVDTVGGVADEAMSWRAVCFYFSQLLEQYRSDYQIQIAVNLLSDLLFVYQGGVFVCADRTIVLVCRNVTKSQLDKAIFQLRYLFMDDPLAYDAAGDENSNFCHIYDLGVEYAEFYQFCRKKLSQSTRQEQQSPENAGLRTAAPAESAIEGASKIFTPTRLAHVEHDLNKADLSRVLRHQPVCAVGVDYDVRKVFNEYYISIAHLRQMLRMDADFLSNRWLFRYLTQLLDERMLDMLVMNPGRYLGSPISLNLNTETVLSRRFKEFDATVKPEMKASIVVEFQVGDIFADIAAYMAASNALHSMGYKVCMDGLTSLSIVHINRERLGFDLAKLQWNADLETDISTPENQAIMQAIKACGRNRVILCRCDTREAISYGQAMSINLFQGRFIDKVLNPKQKTDN